MLSDILSYEEISSLKSILLERSTFYSSMITGLRVKALKSVNEIDFDDSFSNYRYYLSKKELVDKVYKFLSE